MVGDQDSLTIWNLGNSFSIAMGVGSEVLLVQGWGLLRLLLNSCPILFHRRLGPLELLAQWLAPTAVYTAFPHCTCCLCSSACAQCPSRTGTTEGEKVNTEVNMGFVKELATERNHEEWLKI